MNTDAVLELLRQHPVYSVDEPDDQQQMTRQENKFLIGEKQLPNILSKLLPHYRCLSINQHKLHHYKNIYFDTPDLLLFHQHQNKNPKRKKVRIRQYTNSLSQYFEIKKKLKRGISHKERLSISGEVSSALIQGKALLETYKLDNLSLKPVLQIDYDRLCLWHTTTNERITFDLNTRFLNLDIKSKKHLDDRVIIEIKHHDRPHHSYAYQYLKKIGVREIAFSKYCIGTLFTSNTNIKYNNFKPVLLQAGLWPIADGETASC